MQTQLASFFTSPLWQAAKLAIKETMQEHPRPSDDALTTAAKAHQRAGWDNCLDALENVPMMTFETNDLDKNATEEVAGEGWQLPEAVDTGKD